MELETFHQIIACAYQYLLLIDHLYLCLLGTVSRFSSNIDSYLGVYVEILT